VISPDIRAARQSLGLDRKELACKLGVSGRTVEDWEQGRHQPSGAARIVLAGLLANRRIAK